MEWLSSSPRWSKLKIFTYGLATGVMVFPLIRLSRRMSLPNPKALKTSLLPMIRANNEVRSSIGSSLNPGLLSAYSYGGGLQWRLPSLKKGGLSPLTYSSPKLSLLFQLNGDRGSGLVTVETSRSSKKRGYVDTLMVDFSNGERLVIKGETSFNDSTPVKYDIMKK